MYTIRYASLILSSLAVAQGGSLFLLTKPKNGLQTKKQLKIRFILSGLLFIPALILMFILFYKIFSI